MAQTKARVRSQDKEGAITTRIVTQVQFSPREFIPTIILAEAVNAVTGEFNLPIEIKGKMAVRRIGGALYRGRKLIVLIENQLRLCPVEIALEARLHAHSDSVLVGKTQGGRHTSTEHDPNQSGTVSSVVVLRHGAVSLLEDACVYTQPHRLDLRCVCQVRIIESED